MTRMTHSRAIVLAPAIPSLATISALVRILEGARACDVRGLMTAVFERSGAGAETIDWSDPNCWIGVLPSEELRTLARKIWGDSGGTINPRYLYGHYAVVSRLRLMETHGGLLRLAERGRRFLAGDDEILRELVALRTTRRRVSRPEP
jgi:restriction system protein